MNSLSLARTTIGDLLLEGRITCNKDGKPINNVKLTIPDYQRPYKWTARNAIQLLDDIIEAKNDNKEVYRVGTLILHKDYDADGKERFNIVDGQREQLRSLYYFMPCMSLKSLKIDERFVSCISRYLIILIAAIIFQTT